MFYIDYKLKYVDGYESVHRSISLDAYQILKISGV